MIHDDSYHDDYSRDSNSSLRLFDSSVELYHAIRIARTIDKSEPTSAMLQGTLAHLYILEPEKFEANVIIMPPEVTRKHKAWGVSEETNPGKAIITPAEMKLFVGMRDGILRNTKARHLIEADGEVERVIEWDDPATGVPLKMKADKIAANGLIFDLKITDDIDPASWSRKVANFAYHCQAALYLDGAATAQIDGPFLWVVVSRDPPHETTVCTPDDGALAVGRSRNMATLQDLANRRRLNDWSGRWSNSVQTISLPRWAL